ncbi:MAG: U32 family peptidase [Coriobacteriales bacterium]|nr:U32 family peptidase [Coriobacteriales bacterium]
MNPTSNKPELLAPAGSFEALRAAVANGADAVYLGIDRLNARRGAENFTLDTLAEAAKHAHLAGVRVYLTANVLVLPDEMADALDVVDRAWAAGVDAIIVQDLGLMRVVRESLPDVRIHASTQIGAHNSASIATLAVLGVSRVTLARELSLDEIGRASSVAADAGVEVESFAHGALCVCYSGQCLLSSMIGGRSANRGQCAQPCRLPYQLMSGREPVEAPGAYLLSPKDLAAIDVLPDLVGTGVGALKIEGRMKSPEYVAVVTATYRAALDRLAEAPGEYSVRQAEHDALAEVFTRGFSTAYLTGERGGDLMSYRRPNNRGVPVGRVVSGGLGRATIAFDRPVESEDTLEFWTASGRHAQRAGKLEVDGKERTSVPARHRATIETDAALGKGDRVFRVANAALLEAARRTWRGESAKTGLSFSVTVVEGKPLGVEVCDDKQRSGRAEGPVVERARTKAVTAEEVVEHVGRLGGTDYEPAGWQIDLSPDAGVGFSALHRVRRDAIAAYEASLLGDWQRRRAARPQLELLRGLRAERHRVAIVVACDNLGIARAALNAGADEAHVPASLLDGSPQPGIVPVAPRILHDDEVPDLLDSVSGATRVVIGNLGALRDLADYHEVEAHWSLNATNSWTASVLADIGATRVWASPELTGSQVAEVVAASPVPIGLGVWGRQELMLTEHCILTTHGPCARRCETCSRRGTPHVLRDRKGFEFPVLTDERGRSHIFNSVPLDLTRAVPELLETGISAIRLDVTVEGAQRVTREVTRWRRMIQAALADVPFEQEVPSGTVTTGHFFRGVG